MLTHQVDHDSQTLDIQTCVKYSSKRHSSHGSATLNGRTSLDMSQHFIMIADN